MFAPVYVEHSHRKPMYLFDILTPFNTIQWRLRVKPSSTSQSIMAPQPENTTWPWQNSFLRRGKVTQQIWQEFFNSNVLFLLSGILAVVQNHTIAAALKCWMQAGMLLCRTGQNRGTTSGWKNKAVSHIRRQWVECRRAQITTSLLSANINAVCPQALVWVCKKCNMQYTSGGD